MKFLVDPQVTALAGRNDVFGVFARRVAVAQVGYGQNDFPLRPDRPLAVDFLAPPRPGVGLVQPTLTTTFTTSTRPDEANPMAEFLPAFRIAFHVGGQDDLHCKFQRLDIW